MTNYVGDIRLGDTIDVKFVTTAAATGAPTTLAGSPVISAYPGNSTTELTAGITLTVDFDARTGMHNVRVVATGGNGYATATNYFLVITAGTVGGTSAVGYVVGSFSIEARSALMPATAARTLVVDAAGLADANTVKVGPTGSGTTQTARDIGASVLLSAGSGAGQLDFTAGVVKANLAQILGTAITETAGQIAAAFKQFFDVAAPTGTMKAITNVVTATNLTNAPTAGDFTAVMKTSIGTAVAASAVASVTAGVTVTTNNDKTGYSLTAAYDLAKTAAQAGDAMTLTAGGYNAAADALLARNVSGGSSAGRTVKQAFHILRNKTDIAAGTLTVYDTDDASASWTATITTTAGNPISQIDPA